MTIDLRSWNWLNDTPLWNDPASAPSPFTTVGTMCLMQIVCLIYEICRWNNWIFIAFCLSARQLLFSHHLRPVLSSSCSQFHFDEFSNRTSISDQHSIDHQMFIEWWNAMKEFDGNACRAHACRANVMSSIPGSSVRWSVRIQYTSQDPRMWTELPLGLSEYESSLDWRGEIRKFPTDNSSDRERISKITRAADWEINDWSLHSCCESYALHERFFFDEREMH